MLIGNGPDALTRVKMIGNDMELDPGIGTCGKNGQGVPVGVGQPTLRIDQTHRRRHGDVALRRFLRARLGARQTHMRSSSGLTGGSSSAGWVPNDCVAPTRVLAP